MWRESTNGTIPIVITSSYAYKLHLINIYVQSISAYKAVPMGFPACVTNRKVSQMQNILQNNETAMVIICFISKEKNWNE